MTLQAAASFRYKIGEYFSIKNKATDKPPTTLIWFMAYLGKIENCFLCEKLYLSLKWLWLDNKFILLHVSIINLFCYISLGILTFLGKAYAIPY